MLFALDNDGNRVYIENTHIKQDYFCPICGEKLVLKKGNIRKHHFSHTSSSECTDTWHYDMSDWHMNWQSKFPNNLLEIVKTENGIKHRADVLSEDKKIVIEFQHSSLSSEEFNDRNQFYTSLGYKVIWIFDVAEQVENDSFDNYKNNLFKWTRPKRTFNTFVPKDHPNIELFFEVQDSIDENDKLIELKELIKIIWAPENGFENFATDGKSYKEEDIIQLILSNDKEINKEDNESKLLKISELRDNLKEMYSKDHTTYYFGCPRSSSHLCSNHDLDLSPKEFDNIYPCSECEFSKYEDSPCCTKRFADLNLPEDTIVKIIKTNSDGFISQISYFSNGNEMIRDLPIFKNTLGNSIYSLWKENNYKIAIFRNIKTGNYIKICKNPFDQRAKYGKVYGWLSLVKYSFPKKSIELYSCDKNEWICVWYK